MKRVKSQVKELEAKLDRAFPVAIFLVRVQLSQLAQAEKLRLAALSLVKSRWAHRCRDHVGGCTAVSDSKLEELKSLLERQLSFHRPSARMPAAVREIIKKDAAIKRRRNTPKS